jgi:hypothetical protein
VKRGALAVGAEIVAAGLELHEYVKGPEPVELLTGVAVALEEHNKVGKENAAVGGTEVELRAGPLYFQIPPFEAVTWSLKDPAHPLTLSAKSTVKYWILTLPQSVHVIPLSVE